MTTEENNKKNSNQHLPLTTSDLEDFSNLLPKRTKASLPSSLQQNEEEEGTKNKKLDECNDGTNNNINRKGNGNNSNNKEDSALVRNFMIRDNELEDALKFVQDSFPSLGGSDATPEMEQLSSWNNSNIRLTTPDRKQTTLLFSQNAADSSADKPSATASKAVSWKDMNKNEQQFMTDDSASEGTNTIMDNNMSVASTAIDESKHINDDGDEAVGFFDDMYYAWGDCCTSLWTRIKHYAEETKNDCIHEIYMSAADIVENSTCSPNALRQKASKYANNASSMLACAKGYNNNADDDTYTVATFDEDASLLSNNFETDSRNTGVILSQEKNKVRNNYMKISNMRQKGKGEEDSDTSSFISKDDVAIKRFLSADSGDTSFSLGDTITERDESSLASSTYNKSKKNKDGMKDEPKKEDINELHRNLRELQQNMKDVIHETTVLQQMVALQQINKEVIVKGDDDVVEANKASQKPLSLSGTTPPPPTTTTRITKSVVKSREGLGKRGENYTNNKTTSSHTKHTTATTAKQQQQKEHTTIKQQTTSAFSSKKKTKGSSSNKKNKE